MVFCGIIYTAELSITTEGPEENDFDACWRFLWQITTPIMIAISRRRKTITIAAMPPEDKEAAAGELKEAAAGELEEGAGQAVFTMEEDVKSGLA